MLGIEDVFKHNDRNPDHKFHWEQRRWIVLIANLGKRSTNHGTQKGPWCNHPPSIANWGFAQQVQDIHTVHSGGPDKRLKQETMSYVPQAWPSSGWWADGRACSHRRRRPALAVGSHRRHRPRRRTALWRRAVVAFAVAGGIKPPRRRNAAVAGEHADVADAADCTVEQLPPQPGRAIVRVRRFRIVYSRNKSTASSSISLIHKITHKYVGYHFGLTCESCRCNCIWWAWCCCGCCCCGSRALLRFSPCISVSYWR